MLPKGPGFVVLYRWRLHPGKEEVFVQAWSNISEVFLHHHDSLGSRLHKGPDNIWYSYAQWPSEAARSTAFALPSRDPKSMQEMRSSVLEWLPELILESVADCMRFPRTHTDA